MKHARNIAMAKVGAVKKVPLFHIGAAGASLTNEDCTPYSLHYNHDTAALANVAGKYIVKQGGDTALLRYARKFDGLTKGEALLVSREEMKAAWKATAPALQQA